MALGEESHFSIPSSKLFYKEGGRDDCERERVEGKVLTN